MTVAFVGYVWHRSCSHYTWFCKMQLIVTACLLISVVSLVSNYDRFLLGSRNSFKSTYDMLRDEMLHDSQGKKMVRNLEYLHHQRKRSQFENDNSSTGTRSSFGDSTSSQSSYGLPSSTYGSYESNGGASSYSYNSHSVPNKWGSATSKEPIKIDLFWVIILIMLTLGMGTLLTAYQFEHNSGGDYPNFCRLALNTFYCLWMILYNMYRCRLGEIPSVVCASDEYADEDPYTEQELQTMQCRPGIENALEREHARSMRKLLHSDGTTKKKSIKELTSQFGKNVGDKIQINIGPVRKGPGLESIL